MNTAHDVDVGCSGRPAAAVGLLVMELESATLGTAPTFGTDEGALRSIARHDLPADCQRDMPTVGFERILLLRRAYASFAAYPEAPLHAVGDQQVERSFHHFREIAVGQLVSHQVTS